MVVYRNTRPGKVDADTNRRYGETGDSDRRLGRQPLVAGGSLPEPVRPAPRRPVPAVSAAPCAAPR
jgi:hypothetical protein